MLLAGSMILGLTACAHQLRRRERQPATHRNGLRSAVHPGYLVYNVGEEPKTWDPSLTPPAWAAMSF
ncbi:MAG: hypothetical protein ACLSUM_00720 [Dysosmobacter welbionis]